MGYADVYRCQSEVESTFGVNQAESYRDQRYVMESLRRRNPRAVLRDRSVQSRLHRRGGQHRHGSKFGGGFEADFYCDALAAPLITAQAYSHPQTNFAEILRAGFGGQAGGSGSTVLNGGGSTTTSVVVQAGHGTRFAAGRLIACPMTVNGQAVYEVRRVTAVAGDTLTVNMAFAAIPAADSNVLNSATFYLDPTGVGGDGNSLAFRMCGYDPEDQWIWRGCTPTGFSFRSELDELLTVAVNVKAATHSRIASTDAEGLHPPGGAGLSIPTFAGGGPLAFDGGYFFFNTVGVTTRNVVSAHRFAANMDLDVLDARAPDGIETTKRHYQRRCHATLGMGVRWFEPLSASADGEGWNILFEVNSESSLFNGILQIGKNPYGINGGTGMVAIDYPRIEFAESPTQTESDDGFVDVNVLFDADEDRNAGESTEVNRSMVRVAVF